MFYCFIFTVVIILCFSISYFKALSFIDPVEEAYYYGWTGALASVLSAFGLFLTLWPFHGSRNGFLTIVGAVLGGIVHWDFITPSFPARDWCEKAIRGFLILASFSALVITFFITFLLLLETVNFFQTVSILDFITGTEWSPQTIYGDIFKNPEIGKYGAVPLFLGTLMITAIAILMAGPVGLLIAIYLKEYAKPRRRRILKPLIEILAGIPTIVYGFFALIVVMPTLQRIGEILKIEISSQSALGVGIVMGLMIIPYVSSLSEEALGAVPQALRDNSLALGATSAETIQKVVLPAALPGIITAILLAFSRAIGETMLVVMAAGLSPQLTFNPLESVTTVTVQIVSLLTGDQEFNSPKTLSAFALGLSLFLLTLSFNIISGYLLKRHRRKYGL